MWHALVDVVAVVVVAAMYLKDTRQPARQLPSQASAWLSDCAAAATVDFATLQHCEWQVLFLRLARAHSQVVRVNCAWKLAAVADSCPVAARWDVGLLQSISLNCGSYEHGILIISLDWLLSRRAADALALLARLQLVGVRECFFYFDSRQTSAANLFVASSCSCGPVCLHSSFVWRRRCRWRHRLLVWLRKCQVK